MDPCIQKNLEFAKKGLEDGQYLYTIEICKSILSSQANCLEARRLLQIAAKAIYDEATVFVKRRGQVVSLIYLLSAFMFRKRSRLKLIQKAICCYPKGKIAWILFAQVSLEQGVIDLLLFAYEELYLLFPQDKRFGLALGDVYLCVSDYEKALKIGQEILEKDPENADGIILVERAFLGKIETGEKPLVH